MDASPCDENRKGLTQEGLDRLLGWLHADRERAGRILYEEIRPSLVGGFRAHGCPEAHADDLADETILRVSCEPQEFFDAYVGEPLRYFRRVAHFVHLEYLRRQRKTVPLPEDMDVRAPAAPADDVEREYGCLEECISHLRPNSREIVLGYYQGERRVKIELRKALAARLDTKLPQLRLKAHRIRAVLRDCIVNCLEQKAA